MRGTHLGVYVVSSDQKLTSVCPSRPIPPGRYKRKGDTYPQDYMMKNIETGESFLFCEVDVRKLKWEPDP